MAARFWVGGTGNWDAADTTHWAATSNGAGGQSVPGASDDVTFDASSGGGTVTITATQSVLSITGGAHTGTVDFNGQTVTAGTINWSGTGTRTLTLGAATVNITSGSATVLNFGTKTNMTFSGASSTIVLSGTAALMDGGGTAFSYGTVSFTGAGLCGLATGTASGTSFVNLTRTGTAVKTDGFLIRTSITVTGTFTVNGNSVINRVLVQTITLGTTVTITAAAVSCNNCDFIDITGAGAASWDMSAGSVGDCGGNSMKALGAAAFTAAATQTYSGTTSSNWSANAWSGRVPLPQDDVVIASAFSASQTVTADMPRLGKSISWVGSTGNPTWALASTTNSIFGSITLISGMTLAQDRSLSILGRGTHTITMAGKQFPSSGASIFIQAVGGTYTMLDNFSTGGVFVFQFGTWDANGFNVTALNFNLSGSTVRTMIMGIGTWTATATTAIALWNASTTTNMTFSGSLATIVVSAASANTRSFSGGGLTYGTLTYTVAGSTGTLEIVGSNTFTTINFSDVTNARSLNFTAGTTTTILNSFNVQGTSGKLMTVGSITAAGHTLSKTSGVVSCNYLSISRSTAQGGAAWYAGANSTDGGNNSGWIFSAAPLVSAGGGSGGLQARRNLQNIQNIQ